MPVSSGIGLFGKIFGLFLYWKCPECGKRAGKTIRCGREGDIVQRVESRYVPAYPGAFTERVLKQVVVDCWTERSDVKCLECGHEWSEWVAKSDIA